MFLGYPQGQKGCVFDLSLQRVFVLGMLCFKRISIRLPFQIQLILTYLPLHPLAHIFPWNDLYWPNSLNTLASAIPSDDPSMLLHSHSTYSSKTTPQ